MVGGDPSKIKVLPSRKIDPLVDEAMDVAREIVRSIRAGYFVDPPGVKAPYEGDPVALVMRSMALVADGEEAWKAVTSFQPDLVLLDLRMPEMDGLEATRQICQNWPDDRPRLIAMTANAMKGDREKCLDAGMNDYITKPVKPQDLLATITRWIHSPIDP